MNFRQRSKTTLCTLVMALLLAAPAVALELGEAKSRGMIGETANGYIAAVVSSAEADALVSSINQQRRDRYQQIARKNSISLEAVEVRAGQKAIQKTPAGQYVNRGSGWEKK
jgi:uncharacterized protein YdbL (DUF1318 family)